MNFTGADQTYAMREAIVHYRLAKPEDTSAIIEVVNAAFAVEDFFEGTRTDPERIEKLQSEGQFLVGEDEHGRIVAAIYAQERGERGYLGMLAVDPTQQGRGMGRPMMEAGEAFLRQLGCKYADITVLNLRPELMPIYAKWGYVEVGTEPFLSSWREMKPGFQCYCINLAKPL